MPEIKDNLISQIPSHIIESYPKFYDFLRAYYEWLGQDGNPYASIKNHMDYLSFEKSLDSYVDYMKQEYLSDVPDRVLLDKELFIKWSRKFNLARGSHESIKFLFKLLFDEQSAEVYVPKENILKTSDGNWISGESIMMVTYNPSNAGDFQYQIIRQTRPIYQDIVETASAVVQRVRTKYVGRYVLTELSVSNIEGEFKEGFPIVTETGSEEWIIPSLTDIEITNGGASYQRGQRLFTNGNYETFDVVREADIAGEFDTRISSFLDKTDIIVDVDGVVLNDIDFTYDGRTITSGQITVGAVVTVILPTYEGYIVVDDTDETGKVITTDILESPIGSATNPVSLSSQGIGTGFVGSASDGLVRPVKGYYRDTKGFLSSNMYIQDSFFYQSYSYSIKTQQDFSAYADIVKNVLHPAGFALFGQLNFTQVIEIILEYVEDDVRSLPQEFDFLHKYGLGGNYTGFEKSVDGYSKRLYRQQNIDDMTDPAYTTGDVGYDLESEFLSQLADYKYQPLKGWMQKLNLTDLHFYQPQDYFEDKAYQGEYVESGYVAGTFDETAFINTYINTYMATNYSEEGYAE